MSSIFGPRILGKDAYENQRRREKKGEDIYGPKVTAMRDFSARPTPPRAVAAGLGESVPPADVEHVLLINDPPADVEHVPAVIPPPAQRFDFPADADTSGDGYLTEAEVKDALTRQPELYERLLDLELARPKGSRKGVSALLLDFEQTKRTDGPREAVVAKLQAIIGG